jgi:hypothetical protein
VLYPIELRAPVIDELGVESLIIDRPTKLFRPEGKIKTRRCRHLRALRPSTADPPKRVARGGSWAVQGSNL